MDQNEIWNKLRDHALQLADMIKDVKGSVSDQDRLAAGLAVGNVLREAQAAYDLVGQLPREST